MLGRGVIVLSAVLLAGGVALADPPASLPQIQLDVVIARLRPDAWAALKGPLSRSAIPATTKGEPKGAFAGVLPREQAAISAIVEKLAMKGLAKVLARPRLVTLSGWPASFLDGDERALPVPAGKGSVGVQFEEFGTRLNFLPVALADGRIRLEAETEVSELGEKDGDGVAKRVNQRLLATADLSAGQILVIGGITRRDKPEDEYELLIIVTPRILPAGQGGGR